jgi:hypothetical protein
MFQFIAVMTILLIIIIFIQKNIRSRDNVNKQYIHIPEKYHLYSRNFPEPIINDKFFFIKNKKQITRTEKDNFYELLFPGRNNADTCESIPGGGSADCNN